jgi:hypothetical protein
MAERKRFELLLGFHLNTLSKRKIGGSKENENWNKIKHGRLAPLVVHGDLWLFVGGRFPKVSQI